jgi:hypothetical protein
MKNTGVKVLLAASLLAGTACTTQPSRVSNAPASSGMMRDPGGTLPRATQLGAPGTQNPSMLGN